MFCEAVVYRLQEAPRKCKETQTLSPTPTVWFSGRLESPARAALRSRMKFLPALAVSEASISKVPSSSKHLHKAEKQGKVDVTAI